MTTTIQVSDETAAFLKNLRRSMNASSYDEVLREVRQRLTRRESLAGILSNIPKKKLLEGLRDKHDRF